MITEISFPKELTDPVGLQPATLKDLGQLVILAGPNGAGKSRYLRLIESTGDAVSKATTEIQSLNQRKQTIDSLIKQDHAIKPVLDANLKEIQEQLARFKETLNNIKTANKNQHPPRFIHLRYNANGNTGHDPLSSSPSSIDSTAASNRRGGFEQAQQSINAYAHEIARTIYDSEHPRTRNLPELQAGLSDTQQFNKTLNSLLQSEITFSLNNQRRIITQFRGRPFDPAELSKGELLLFVWAILLHRQREWLRGAYLLLDEPENHLHPDVCIRTLKALQNDILGPDGQIWVATHSIPLIAYAKLDAIHFVDNGRIEYAGNKIELVLNRLLGGQDGRDQLRTLMADADELAFETFAAQCLLPPGVAEPSSGDPQMQQITNAVRSTKVLDEPLRILDFAAGQGRLASALEEIKRTSPSSNFLYYAFHEPAFASENELRECQRQIAGLNQPGSPSDYLLKTLDHLTLPGSKPIDVVTMCNVLHEIPVRNWIRHFRDIHKVLADDGYLLIVEDQLPSVGELPHEGGYIIMDELALKHLFGSQDAVRTVSIERDGRLTAFGIARNHLLKATTQTLEKAILQVKSHALSQLRQIRDTRMNGRSMRVGRKHAHFTMLYANAHLASEEFPSN
ncbi:methyltransferase domain-containing protein [Corallococcus sp. CA049B]|uniref:AAA family ATPase n=1 Tax=Corallococcus sp. CA049B TaxID=2316730 RepID=UPI000EA25DA9|nr:AAA family ATPase [Corallococcus sp. CA049B]RKG90694.1 methyltransferase domain-containing protein [Corallococcus sp. CA049B]